MSILPFDGGGRPRRLPVETPKPRGRRLNRLAVVFVLCGAFWAAIIYWIVGIVKEIVL